MASRVKNTKRNIIISYINTFFSCVFQFISRTIIINTLGDEYLGISSLFTSILSVLSMAELGFSGSIVYNMYRPLAEGDTKKVCALLNYYKKVYRIVGIVVLVSGAMVTPFVPKLINGSCPSDINIYIAFDLYLLNTSVSYFLFSYKTSLVEALQRMDLTKVVYLVVLVLKNTLQIIALCVFHSYYLFVVVLIVSTSVQNIAVALLAKKKYPQYVCQGEIDEATKKDIISRVKGLLICSISGITYSTFDSIIISSFIGLTTVAIYNNYILIFSAVSSLISMIRQAMQASVGNSVSNETVEKNYQDMLLWQYFFSAIASFCSICLLCLYQPFMIIWMGSDRLLPFIDVVLLAIWFNTGVVQHAFFLYLSGNGLWWELRWPYISSTICNLVLNILLGKWFGTTGIIAASLIASVVFCLIWQSSIIFKCYFKRPVKQYLLRQLTYFLITIPAAVGSFYLCSLIQIEELLGFVVRCVICAGTSSLFLFLIYRKFPIYDRAKIFFINVLKMKK